MSKVIRDCQLRVPATALMAERAVAYRLANALCQMMVAYQDSQNFGTYRNLAKGIAYQERALIEARAALVEWRDGK